MGMPSFAPVAPYAISSIQMIPAVFCASLPPWPSEYIDADISCNRRDHRSTFRGVACCAIIEKITINNEASKNPSNGEITMNATTLMSPLDTSDPAPALAMAAPTSPPISACDELDGMP